VTERHTLDGVDRAVLHALAVDGRAPFSRIAQVLGVSDQTVARRFRRLRERAGLRVVGVRDRQQLGGDTWMLRLRCTPDAAQQIARALARRPDTAWVALTSAGTELVCMTGFRTRGEHEELVLGKLPRTPSIVEIRAHLLLHRFYGGPAGWLLKQPAALSEAQAQALRPSWSVPGPAEHPAGLTAADEALVQELERDGRATFAELQDATGRPESSLRRRLDQLLGSRAVFLDVEFDADLYGYATRALLWVTAEPRHLDRVGRAMAGHREVAFAAATTGDSNLLAAVVCRDAPSLYRYLHEDLGRLEGVRHVEAAPELRQVKQHTYAEQTRQGRAAD
jgi:DNA-binding Lrp family transcriptional regulator